MVPHPNYAFTAMEAEEQRRIEAGLRRRLDQPRYPALFELPSARLIVTRKPLDWKPGNPACLERAHAREPRAAVLPGGHNDYAVSCAKSAAHDGPHSTRDEKIPFSKSMRRWEWRSDSPTQATGLPPQAAS